MPSRNDALDIWQYINTENGDAKKCWLWIGSLSGKMQDRGQFSHGGKKHQAHRFVFEMINGPLAEGEVVRHTCDNSLCCNPTHLIRGTKSENERDKYMRDRAGLPVRVVREIKRLLETTDYSQVQIAAIVTAKFNISVSREAVRNIKLNKRRTDGEMTAEEVMQQKENDDE